MIGSAGSLVSNRNLLRLLVAFGVITIFFGLFFVLPTFNELDSAANDAAQNFITHQQQPPLEPRKGQQQQQQQQQQQNDALPEQGDDQNDVPGSSDKLLRRSNLDLLDVSPDPDNKLVMETENQLCLSWTYKPADLECGIVKVRECSSEELSKQVVWHYDNDRLSSGDSCLTIDAETRTLRICKCSEEAAQMWEVSPMQITNMGFEDTCLSFNPETNELGQDRCSKPTTQGWVIYSFLNQGEDDYQPVEQVSTQKETQKEAQKETQKVIQKEPQEDTELVDEVSRNRVKEFMKLAWDNYVMYAWGADELQPLAKAPRNWLGKGLAATIVDAIDTLYIMGMEDEYAKARSYILDELSFSNSKTVSFFETTIRDLGGLLAIYALTKDERYIEKAKDLGDRLLPAFNSKSGLPFSLIDLTSGSARNQAWNPGNHILAEIGTIQLEFKYLSEITGNPVYAEKAGQVMEILKGQDSADPGLFPVFYPDSTGNARGTRDYTLGGLGDSFYEYLLKQWLQTSKTETRFKEKYDQSSQQIKKLMYSQQHGHHFVGKFKNGFLEPEMEHLACFTGGMFALGAFTQTTSTQQEDLEMGRQLTKTCRNSYADQATGLGPERFAFKERITADSRSDFYWLRPEYVESLFYLWRITKDPIYRQWGKDVIDALETYCKKPTGFVGITGVNSPSPGINDVQESYFLAETLKYLYLLFSGDSLISLDEYVFNTEAHPLPIFKPTVFDFSTK